MQCPDIGLQNSLIATLERAIREDSTSDRHVLFLGAIEIGAIPDSSHEMALAGRAGLINLPSVVQAEGVPGALTHALATNLNGFELVERTGAAPDIVRNALLTMACAQQFDYLRTSGIVGAESTNTSS
jgi:hypothetical protein